MTEKANRTRLTRGKEGTAMMERKSRGHYRTTAYHRLWDITEKRWRISEHFASRLLLIAPELSEDVFPPWTPIEMIPEVEFRGDESRNFHAAVTPRCAEWSNGTISILSFRIALCTHFLGRPLPYSTLLRNAIHEAAHVAGWYEKLRRNDNKFSQAEFKLQNGREDHGRDFHRRDSDFVCRARDLGIWRPRIAPPDEAKGLFFYGLKPERLKVETEVG